MNKFELYKKVSFSLLVLLSLVSCKKDDTADIDRKKPVISDVSIRNLNGSDHIVVGDTLYFECKVRDNKGVSSVKVDIHFAGDGHSHRILTTNLAFTEVFNLDAKMDGFGYQLFVPNNTTPGDYHFTIQAIDLSGNESDIWVTKFDIEQK